MQQQVTRLQRYKQASLFFVFTLLLMGSAGKLMAQAENITAPVTLEAATIALPDVLQALQKQSAYTFTYDKTKLANITLHQIRWNKTPLGKALTELKQKAGLDYTLLDNNIAITLKPVNTTPGNEVKKNNGILAGKITDEENNEPVAGATIKVSGKTTMSGPDGAFSLALPEGKFTAEISFVGYVSQKITDIVIKGGQSFTITVSIKRALGTLKGVVVTHSASRASVASLYARQKNAAGITDGISAEQIGRTPDKNIAETLRRISGVTNLDNKYVVVRGLSERYNQAMLNGQLMPSTELNRKNFSFDLIPSNLVDNVIVSKTITPDQPAEFGGGLVQVNTKDLPTENSFSVNIGGSYNDKTTGKEFRAPAIDNSAYFGGIADNRKLFGSTSWKSRAAILNNGHFEMGGPGNQEGTLKDPALFANNWELYRYKPLPSINGQLSLTRMIPLKEEQQLGVIASVSYRNTWQTQDIRMSRDGYIPADLLEEKAGFTGKRYSFVTNLGGMAGIGYRRKGHKISLQTLYLRTLDQQFVTGTGSHETWGQAAGYNDLLTVTSLWQNQLKTEHALNKKGMRLNLTLSYTHLDRQKPDNKQANLVYVGKGENDPSNPDADYSITSAGSAGISSGALRWWSRALEKNLAWNADLSIPFAFKIFQTPVTNVLKTGYAGWKKDRLFWVLITGQGFPSGVAKPLSEFFDGGSIHSPMFGDDFHRKPEQHAGYVMMDNKIGKRLRLVYGVRAEYYALNGFNALLEDFVEKQRTNNNDLTDYSDLFNREPNWNFFPSANITYSLTPKMNLRLAYSKSIIRPDLREISFFREYDFELGGSYWSQSPIISTKIHHYDFRYEYYPSAGEVMSVSLFYKKLLYPMEIFAMPNRLFELRNDKDAINKGIEIEVRKSLAFTKLPVLKNITLYGNFTRLFSTVRTMTLNYNGQDANNPYKLLVNELIGPEEDRPQSGASNYIYNAGLGYEHKYFSLNASFNYLTNRFYRVGDANTGSLYEQPMKLLDAQLAVKLLQNKGLVKLSVGNLLDSKYIIYTNLFEGNLTYPADGRKPTTKELQYQKSDLLDYEAAPGRTWSLSFHYNF